MASIAAIVAIVVLGVPLAAYLCDAWAGKKRWVELVGAGHNSTDRIPLFWESIRAFLRESGT